MKEIPLTQGKVAIVDDEDFASISSFKWCAMKVRGGKYYAIRSARIAGKKCQVLMHRVIGGTATTPEVDHENNDGLDNRRQNLRPCTSQQARPASARPRRRSSSPTAYIIDCERGQENYDKLINERVGVFQTTTMMSEIIRK
jgi:hypothetical protein